MIPVKRTRQPESGEKRAGVMCLPRNPVVVGGFGFISKKKLVDLVLSRSLHCKPARHFCPRGSAALCISLNIQSSFRGLCLNMLSFSSRCVNRDEYAARSFSG